MRTRRVLLIVIGVAVLVALGALMFWPSGEPEYGGKRLSEWVEQLFARTQIIHVVLDDREASVRAIRHIGTNGIPYLIKYIGSKQPAWQRKLSATVNPALRRVDPSWQLTDRKHWARASGAVYALIALGTNAAAAVPELKKMTKDASPALRLLTTLEKTGVVYPHLLSE